MRRTTAAAALPPGARDGRLNGCSASITAAWSWTENGGAPPPFLSPASSHRALPVGQGELRHWHALRSSSAAKPTNPPTPGRHQQGRIQGSATPGLCAEQILACPPKAGCQSMPHGLPEEPVPTSPRPPTMRQLGPTQTPPLAGASPMHQARPWPSDTGPNEHARRRLRPFHHRDTHAWWRFAPRSCTATPNTPWLC